MLISNSIGLSTLFIIDASRNRACSLYFFRRKNKSISEVSVWLISDTCSVGSSPKIVFNSNKTLPR